MQKPRSAILGARRRKLPTDVTDAGPGESIAPVYSSHPHFEASSHHPQQIAGVTQARLFPAGMPAIARTHPTIPQSSKPNPSQSRRPSPCRCQPLACRTTAFVVMVTFPCESSPHHSSFPPALERVKLCIGGSISRAFGFGSNLIVCVGNESADDASKGDDLSKWYHGLRSHALPNGPVVRNWGRDCKLSVHKEPNRPPIPHAVSMQERSRAKTERDRKPGVPALLKRLTVG